MRAPPTSAWMRIGELSRRAGVPAETLRAWERRYGLLRPRRSGGNTRLYSAVDEARVRVMRRYLTEGVAAAQAAELALSTRLSLSTGPGGTIPEDDAETARRRLREALTAFDDTAADAVLHGLLARHGLTPVLGEVIVPVARTPGAEPGGTERHFTAVFLESRLLALAGSWSRGLGPQAVIAAAPSDRHTIGLICCGLALHQLGWRVTYLGAAAPFAAVRGAVAATAAQLAVISCAVPGELEASEDVLAEIGRTTVLAVGGPAVTPAFADACGGTLLEDPVSAPRAIALELHAPGADGSGLGLG